MVFWYLRTCFQSLIHSCLLRLKISLSSHSLSDCSLQVSQSLYILTCYFRLVTVGTESFGLPWWLTGRESTCQCRRHKFDPWSGKILRATEQLNSAPQQEKPSQWEVCTTTTSKPVQQQRPAQPKINNLLKVFV